MRISAAGAILVLIVSALFLARPALIADLDAKACDLLTQWAGPGRQSGHVAIVEIDEKSLEQVGRWPWPRTTIGRLTRNILDAGAEAVALDMMFAQEEGEDDRVLAQDLAGRPAVAGYAFLFDNGVTNSPGCPIPPLPMVAVTQGNFRSTTFFHATGVVCNARAIAAAAFASGFLNAAPDHDGVLRHVPAIVEYEQRQYPSLALAAANAHRHGTATELNVDRAGLWRLRLDEHVVPLEPESMLRLRFRGRRRTFPYVTAADVLAGTGSQDVLRGKIVVVGGSAPGMESSQVTPADSLFPAVEVQATAIDNILAGDSFYRSEQTRLWEVALALLAGCLSTLVLARARFAWGVLATVALVGGAWILCEALLVWGGILFSPLPATAALGCALPVVVGLQYLDERNRAERTQRQLIGNLQHAQGVLKKSEDRYRRLVENVNDAIIMDDVQGKLLFANRRFREWFGVAEGDETHLSLEDFVAPEWRAEVRDRHDRRMRGEDVSDHFEFEGIRSDGSRIWLEALVATVEDKGRIVGSQAALRDTTERRRMEAQYLQAQKMESVGRLAGGVAHDFNNLLTVINGYSALLLEQLGSDTEFRHYAAEIRKAGDQAADLTKKLLSFSRKQKVNPGPVNLNLLVTEAQGMLERVIGEDIRLVTHLSPDLEDVVADPGQINQVLMNLVVNARDAMPNGGELKIGTRNVVAGTSEPQVCLSVSDTGTGLRKEVKEHLFEPFFTTKDLGKGTGLGLATIYGIVQQNGGRIEVSSVWGQGATFEIFLPSRKAGTAEQPAPVPAASETRGSETVLLVEDQEAVREFTTTILREFGYHVMEASNGSDALAIAENYTGPIHLLLADIVLPVMDGRMVAEKLKEIHAETRVLYISGYSQERIGSTREVDELPLLRKPFTPEALRASVRRVLGGEENRTAV